MSNSEQRWLKTVKQQIERSFKVRLKKQPDNVVYLKSPYSTTSPARQS